MSQVYLTKIERKTIFTRALIYVLIMFLVADLTVTGPFWVNFIPWLFILALIGSLKGIDKILTCIIGGFTVFISSVIIENGVNTNVLLNTVVALVNIVAGIAAGKCIYQFVLEHRLVKYLRPRKKVALIALVAIFACISIFTNAMLNGNVISYLMSRKNLESYIEKTYTGVPYEITKTEYTKEVEGDYLHLVKIDGQDVWFTHMTNKEFKDANIDSRLSSLNEKLNKDFSLKISDIFSKSEDEYSLIKETNISAIYEYKTVSINPDSLTVYIECNVSKKDTKELYKELVKLIKEITSLRLDSKVEISKVMLCINKVEFEIFKEDFAKLNLEYITGGFEIEELDE